MKFYKTLFVLFTVSLFSICYGQNTGIIPTPQQITFQSGEFVWNHPVLTFDAKVNNAKLLEKEFDRLMKTKGETQNGNLNIHFIYQENLLNVTNYEQAYRLKVTENEITVEATSERGWFYGLQSLVQLYRFHYRKEMNDNEFVKIPCLTVLDFPAYEKRGWMDDISRGPIPTMDFLKKQIETLAEFKLNVFTLYTEHTFKSKTYNYSPADGLTTEQIQELQTFAKEHYVEIIGNQQCFAHFEKILCQPEFAYLADSKCNLNPGISDTYDFLNDIIKEETAAYASDWFNINCDETEALGSGNAAKYVKKIGASEAYIRHIVKVNDMVKNCGKKTMMWADIVLKDKEIQKKLPKDITMLVWSYVPADSFEQMVQTVQEAGYDFWVVPGVSCWSTVFPSMVSYEKNIANFARDGKRHGARGLLNTAWNDSGEALLNSAWHGFVWGAEMAWKPIENTEKEASEKERSQRISTFDTNFNFQFFHFFNNENIIADFLRTVPDYENSPVKEIYNNGSLWGFKPLQFLPDNLTDNALRNIKEERFNTMRTSQLLRLILSEEDLYDNSDIIYTALYATNRLMIDLILKRFQFILYDLYKHPEKITESDKDNALADIADMTEQLQFLKESYAHEWDESYRPYWKDVNENKYDKLIKALKDIPQNVFIETQTVQNQTEVTLRTLFNDYSIYYTLDGSEPTRKSLQYNGPITIDETKTVKTVTIDDDGTEVRNEKKILVHKGMGHLTNVEGNYSTYRSEYSGGGKFALADGHTGSDSYRDGKWQGYQGQDVSLYYHWNSETTINNVTVRFLQNFYDWILAPTDIEIYVKKGNDYVLAKKRHFNVEQISGNRVGFIQMDKLKIKSADIKIKILNPGPLPKEHGAHGAESFIFLDEVIVK